jgi:phosphopantothenoylcysteine decarboxylase/phosphopantothenate--cysteine ligase
MVPSRLKGKRVLITAGPTYEPIDPVRFIGNRSSGKMGFELANAAVEAGAEVVLVAGPVHQVTPSGVRRIDIETAQQMYDAVMAINDVDIVIGCAAVADYRPLTYQEQKIKKSQQDMHTLTLTENRDIIAAVRQRTDNPFVVGFAAETENVADYAKSKMHAKQLDMVAANRVGKGLGFGSDTNALAVFWPQGEKVFAVALKSHLARDLMTLIIERYDAKNSTQDS